MKYINYVEEIGELDQLQNRKQRTIGLALVAAIVALFFMGNSILETLFTLEFPEQSQPTARQVIVTVEASQVSFTQVQATEAEPTAEPSETAVRESQNSPVPSLPAPTSTAGARETQSNALQNSLRGNR